MSRFEFQNCIFLGLTISDIKLWLALTVLFWLGLTLLIHFVGDLVIDEQVGWALACHPSLENGFWCWLLERVL